MDDSASFQSLDVMKWRKMVPKKMMLDVGHGEMSKQDEEGPSSRSMHASDQTARSL